MIRIPFLLATAIAGCCNIASAQNSRSAKSELFEAEASFCQLAKDSGIAVAFRTFAAEDAAICRDAKLIVGRNEIAAYYKDADTSDRLEWKPIFADVASSLDLGYTYGEYDFTGVRSGKVIKQHGAFHTVWRKQKDGKWKFVVD